jgi:hypothetical protein
LTDTDSDTHVGYGPDWNARESSSAWARASAERARGRGPSLATCTVAPGLEGYDTSFPCFARACDFDRAVGKSCSSYMSRGDYILIKTFLPARARLDLPIGQFSYFFTNYTSTPTLTPTNTHT